MKMDEDVRDKKYKKKTTVQTCLDKYGMKSKKKVKKKMKQSTLDEF